LDGKRFNGKQVLPVKSHSRTSNVYIGEFSATSSNACTLSAATE
jgi:hypothetical protein